MATEAEVFQTIGRQHLQLLDLSAEVRRLREENAELRAALDKAATCECGCKDEENE